MSLRKLRVLVEHLPTESATARALRGHHWTDSDYLLADLRDLTAFHRYEYVKAHDGSMDEPQPVPRPGEIEQTPDDARAVARAAHDDVMRQLKKGAA